ncbi:hypothetical protein M3Y99_01052300 [Aphelenchoides fujianensis]|nr:hypothetical protein M3Y99_01052300 [Aphelenchoides fujianensis]
MANKYTDSCAPTNPLQNLSANYAQSNARVRSGAERQIDRLLPSASTGDAVIGPRIPCAEGPTDGRSLFVPREVPGGRRGAAVVALGGGLREAAARDGGRPWAREFAANSRFDLRPMAAELPQQWADEFAAKQQAAGHQTAALVPRHEEWARDFDQWLSGDKTAAQTEAMETAWFAAGNEQENREQSGQVLLFTFSSSCWSQQMSDQWASEFTQKMFGDAQTDEILEEEFDSIFRSGLAQYNNFNPLDELPAEYSFVESNPHLTEADLMQRASEQLQSGNTQEAILYYEAAVQRNPHDADAWCRLGLSHAENEHDIAAISAFRKALEVAPGMRDALLGYSVSLANESYDNEALHQLDKWIHVYKGGESTATVEPPPSTSALHQSYIDPAHFEKVEARFLDAARTQANGVDPELQNALGVLYNLNRNFDRAVDSIKAAIARNPDDPRLWNRLGATLANGDRTAEAIEAYRHALTLFPAYVRARYNLGISCMHLNCYREATEHFLSALRLQKANESSPIWSTLRSSIIRMNAEDGGRLMSALNDRNIEGLHNALATST